MGRDDLGDGGPAVSRGDTGVDRSSTVVDESSHNTTTVDDHSARSSSYTDSSSRVTTVSADDNRRYKRSRWTISLFTRSGDHSSTNTTVAVVAVLAVAMVAVYALRSPHAGTPDLKSTAQTGHVGGVTLADAIALASAGRVAEAVEAFQALRVAEPDNPVVLANLCGALLQSGSYLSAESACHQAAGLAPANWLAQFNLSCALALTGRAAEATEALARALAAVDVDPKAGVTREQLIRQARSDEMLRTLRGTPAFETLMRTP